MAYDLSNITSRKPSPYITYGGNQQLKINQIELVSAKSTGTVKAVLYMETLPVKDDNFEPVDGAKGRVGKVGCGVYMKHEGQKKDFLEKMLDIAKALGLESEYRKIKADSFEETVAQIERLLTAKDKYAMYTVFGEEYSKSNGSTGLRLMFPRWNFVEPVGVAESKIVQFDVNNPAHLKKATKEDNSYSGKSVSTSSVDEISDLPF